MPENAIMQRFEAAWTEREQWRPQFDAAFRLAMPGRNLFTTTSPGARKNATTYDSTLQISTQRFANRLQSVLMPPERAWADIVLGRVMNNALKANPKHRQRLNILLRDITDAVFAHLYVSNFDTSINEVFLDLSVSTGVMLVVRTKNPAKPISFISIPLSQVALEDGPHGGVGAVFRKYRIKARNIPGTWEDFKAPEGWDEQFAKEEFKNEDLECMEATYKEGDNWYYCVYLLGFKGSFRQVVERELKINPWIVVRWTKLAGEAFGRGPVLSALPDAQVADKTKEYILKNASLAISPPLRVIDDGVVNLSTLRLVPGALLPVARNAGALGPSIDPLVTGANFDVGALVLADLEKSIKKTMLDSDLPDEQSGVRSATEYMARLRELQNDVGSPFGRLNEELIRPLFNIVLYYMHEAGTLQKIFELHGFPYAPLHLDGINLDVEIKGPLAQAQTLDELDSISTALQLISSLGPEAMLYGIKVEELPQMIWEHLHLPPDMIRGEEEKQAMREATANAINQAQQEQGAGAVLSG